MCGRYGVGGRRRGVPIAGSAVELPSACPSDFLFLPSHPLLGVVGLPRREGEDRRHTEQQRVLQCERSGGLGSGAKTHIDTHTHTDRDTHLQPNCRNLVYGEICSGTVATQADMEEYLRRVKSTLGVS